MKNFIEYHVRYYLGPISLLFFAFFFFFIDKTLLEPEMVPNIYSITMAVSYLIFSIWIYDSRNWSIHKKMGFENFSSFTSKILGIIGIILSSINLILQILIFLKKNI